MSDRLRFKRLAGGLSAAGQPPNRDPNVDAGAPHRIGLYKPVGNSSIAADTATTKDGSRSKQGWPGCGGRGKSEADYMLASLASGRCVFTK